LPLEGEEAWIAYDLLIRPHAQDDEAVPPISADRERDALWVSACKIARHLRVDAPEREPGPVEAFVRQHLDAYLAMRAEKGHE
jgi:hypothetical protein